jgi:hypothetical protein
LGAATSLSLLAAAIAPIGFPLLPTPSRRAAIATAVTTERMMWSEALLASLEQAKTAAKPVTTALLRLES